MMKSVGAIKSLRKTIQEYVLTQSLSSSDDQKSLASQPSEIIDENEEKNTSSNDYSAF